MLIRAEKLKNVLVAMLPKTGSDRAEAEVVADHPVRANLTGHDSHGAGMIPAYIRNQHAGLLLPGTKARLLRDDGAILVGYRSRDLRELRAVRFEMM